MPADLLLRPLLALSDEGAAAPATDPPWPGESHAAIRASDSYSAFARAAAAESPELGRLMAGATLDVAHELGSYSTTMPDGAWVVARLLDDGTRLAAAQGQMGREAVHRGLGRALDGLLDALSSGSCPTTSYLGLRGISLADADAADIGVGVLRRLDPEEVRSFASETDSWPAREDELCLVLESKATWSVSDAPLQSGGAGTQAVMARLELFPALLLLAGTRNRQGRLRAPHVVWNRKSPYFSTGGALGGGFNPDLHWRTSDSYDGIVTPAVAEESRLLLPSLSRAPTTAFRVAAHRLVSAGLVYNKSAEDRLVDAAVAWEALFGSQDRDQLSLHSRSASRGSWPRRTTPSASASSAERRGSTECARSLFTAAVPRPRRSRRPPTS
ncbi:MAG TPA: hypothetical protein VFD59_00425 [Nocardioidaceae bacterium]|nr:hypothetical protein [Nocardioidaceae bacterium]